MYIAPKLKSKDGENISLESVTLTEGLLEDDNDVYIGLENIMIKPNQQRVKNVHVSEQPLKDGGIQYDCFIVGTPNTKEIVELQTVLSKANSIDFVIINIYTTVMIDMELSFESCAGHVTVKVPVCRSVEFIARLLDADAVVTGPIGFFTFTQCNKMAMGTESNREDVNEYLMKYNRMVYAKLVVSELISREDAVKMLKSNNPVCLYGEDLQHKLNKAVTTYGSIPNVNSHVFQTVIALGE